MKRILKLIFILLFLNACSTLNDSVRENDLNTVINKINQGYDINAFSRRGLTLLHVAVEYDNYKIVKYLLESGANPNISDGSFPPIFFVKSAKTLKLLLKHGANPNALMYEKSHLTQYSVSNPRVLQYLMVEKLANFEIVKVLLEGGANPLLTDALDNNYGVTILDKYKLMTKYEVPVDGKKIKSLLELYSTKPYTEDYADALLDALKTNAIGLSELDRIKKCDMKEKGWYFISKCNRGYPSGNGIAINPYTYQKFLGAFSLGALTKGRVMYTDKVLYEGVFYRGMYSKGTIYNNGAPLYFGKFKKNMPNGKGSCWWKGRKEACEYRNAVRVDPIFMARAKRYCNSNPFPISELQSRFKSYNNNKCERRHRDFMRKAGLFRPDQHSADDFLGSRANSASSCLRKLLSNNSTKELKPLLSAASENIELYRCNTNQPVVKNALAFKDDLNKLDELYDYYADLKGEVSSAYNDLQGAEEDYQEQVQAAEAQQNVEERETWAGGLAKALNESGLAQSVGVTGYGSDWRPAGMDSSGMTARDRIMFDGIRKVQQIAEQNNTYKKPSSNYYGGSYSGSSSYNSSKPSTSYSSKYKMNNKYTTQAQIDEKYQQIQEARGSGGKVNIDMSQASPIYVKKNKNGYEYGQYPNKNTGSNTSINTAGGLSQSSTKKSNEKEYEYRWEAVAYIEERKVVDGVMKYFGDGPTQKLLTLETLDDALDYSGCRNHRMKVPSHSNPSNSLTGYIYFCDRPLSDSDRDISNTYGTGASNARKYYKCEKGLGVRTCKVHSVK